MAFSNAYVELRIGNVESRLIGPAPTQDLDRALNPHLSRGPAGEEGLEGGNPVCVYQPGRGIFLTGALPAMKRALRRCGVGFRIKDHRVVRSRREDWTVRGVTLRDYQREVVLRALEVGHGLIDVGTGGGKTLLAASIVAELGLPTLWLVTTRTLLAQTVRSVRDLLGVEPGVIGDGEHRPDRLTVALIQSLPERVDLERWSGGTLVFDEGHHAAAGTWQETIRRIAPRHHYYLSAVPFRAGRDQVVLDALAGERLTGGRYSAQFLIERGYACPVEVVVERCRIAGEMTERPFASLYREFVVENPARNARIAEIVCGEAGAGRSVLVLVDRIRHGEILLDLIGDVARFVRGGTARDELRETTERFTAGGLPVLIATTGLFQEGVSIDGIEALVMAGGLRSKSRVIQTVGRGMRRAKGKAACRFFDFYDDDEAGVLRQHSQARFRVLKEEGFLVPEFEEAAGKSAAEAYVPATWSHVPGSRRFVLVDGEGRLRARGVCLRKDLVPDETCGKCRKAICEGGGRITWREDRA